MSGAETLQAENTPLCRDTLKNRLETPCIETYLAGDAFSQQDLWESDCLP